MNDQKAQIVQKLQSANNILVTVHTDPTVDQLAAAIALTLLLNKMNKHATAVFSGKIPPAIQFLQPEETIEKNTDSLRDFIVALDKGKADKLKYKVEDEVVKIFITPYKSSITEKDLIFSQGDFNVDVVVALGVHEQQDLDEAITAHGRILHDATVITINNTADGELGSINWRDESASGVSEMVTNVAADLGENLLDSQIATALLTGVVAETDHFSNARTTPQTMTISATLLGAGANQQLVANQLDMTPGQPGNAVVPVPDTPAKPAIETPKNELSQPSKKGKGGKQIAPLSKQESQDTGPAAASTVIEPVAERHGQAGKTEASLQDLLEQADAEVNQPLPPTLPAPVSVPTDNSPLQPVAIPQSDDAVTPTDMAAAADVATTAGADAASGKTLADIEEEVQSPHADQSAAAPDGDGGVDDARKAVEDALKAGSDEPPMLEPLEALNAQAVDIDLGHGSLNPAPEPLPSDNVAAPVVTPNEAPDLPPYEPTPVPGNNQNLPPLTPPSEEPPAPAPAADSGMMSTPPVPPPAPAGMSGPSGAPAFGPAPISPLPPAASGVPPSAPAGIGPLPPNPAVNEPAPLTMSPADQPFTMPLPPSGMGGLQVPPPQVVSPTGAAAPPQGPPPPPVPPPLTPGPGMQ